MIATILKPEWLEKYKKVHLNKLNNQKVSFFQLFN